VVKRRDIVTFLSDYGLQDEFVGVCHGVMLRIAPHLRIVDVHHNIYRQNILHGAVVLQQSLPYLPDSVHLAVVDPAVGSERRAIAIESGWGEVFVGPDNGLLMPAAAASGGVKHVVELTDQRFMLTPKSHTFHGRDVFAPVAAHIGNGVDLAELGEELQPSDLVPLDIPIAWVHDDHLHAEILQIDRFGNLQLNFGKEQLDKVGLNHGRACEVRVEGHRLTVSLGATFSDVEPGEFVLVEDAYRCISLAVNNGDAAAKLRAISGSTAIVGPTES
jgi:S-adenosylmethionine hydrolase